MARGWESKAVEDQMDEAEKRALMPNELRPTSPAERERAERLEALRLSHARTSDQLRRARAAAHRQMLERALTNLERQISDLQN